MYSPQKVAKIFVVCCILHNIAKRHGLDHDEEREDDVIEPCLLNQQNAAGMETRNAVILSHFS